MSNKQKIPHARRNILCVCACVYVCVKKTENNTATLAEENNGN